MEVPVGGCQLHRLLTSSATLLAVAVDVRRRVEGGQLLGPFGEALVGKDAIGDLGWAGMPNLKSVSLGIVPTSAEPQ